MIFFLPRLIHPPLALVNPLIVFVDHPSHVFITFLSTILIEVLQFSLVVVAFKIEAMFGVGYFFLPKFAANIKDNVKI